MLHDQSLLDARQPKVHEMRNALNQKLDAELKTW